ncbi:MAG: CDP-alcohol phosphatidyltransferase family protein [Oscillospiraceae bacterium]|nr:CDP-alcohol phosphatidyltransferase family protein [Oscillospiraceae bacterium]
MLHLIGFYDYTVILTYMSLVSAVTGILFSGQGHFSWAILCLMLSGLCDAFDGAVARSKKNRTQDEKAFGIQIDSLCDAVSFGVFPALLCYFLGVNGILGTVIVAVYVLCAVIRLAFFNVMEEKRQQTETGSGKYYRGMPVTTISMILPPFYLLRSILSAEIFIAALHILLITSAFLFVLDFPVKKLDWSRLLPSHKS